MYEHVKKKVVALRPLLSVVSLLKIITKHLQVLCSEILPFSFVLDNECRVK